MPLTPESHREAVEEWRQERFDRLTHPDGWLSLAGLFWLVPGENRVGSDPDSDIVLPDSAPAHLGVLRYEPPGETPEGEARAASYRLEMSPGEVVKINGEEVRSRDLESDVQGATVVEVGSVTFHVIDRGEKVGVRVKDSESELLKTFAGIEYFPISWDWRVEARYTPHDPPKVVSIPSVIGTSSDLESPGRVEFEWQGSTYGINALHGADDDEIWLIFGDLSNKTSTYGGGRFLYANIEPDSLDQAGPVMVDFNRAYNPPCAFTPYATCPLPPREHRLDLSIEAGEKRYAGEHH